MCLMAKRKYSGWFFPRVNANQGLASLASNDSIVGGSFGAVDNPSYAASARLTWNIKDLTVGEGPIYCGLAHSDYSATEIEEWFEVANTWQLGDQVSQERVKRKIRQVGVFSGELQEESLNNGRPIKTKLGFGLPSGSGITQWAYNDSGSALTTGSSINISGNFAVRNSP